MAASMFHVALPCLFTFLFLLLLSQPAQCWDADDFELFDLVEEVNQNFYELMGVDQSAKSADIRRAYRKLSLQLHPDKNKEDDAEVRFRNLVAVHEVLRDEGKRKKYDEILVNGLPDWRQPIYYYRKVRKMGLLEMTVLLLIIFTTGQFLVSWAVYLERKYEMEEVLSTSLKRNKKKSKKSKNTVDEDEVEEFIQNELDAIPRPQWSNLIPIKIVTSLFGAVLFVPHIVPTIKQHLEERRQRQLEEERRKEEEEEEKRNVPVRERKKKTKQELPEYQADLYNGEAVVYTAVKPETENAVEETNMPKKLGEWSEDDLSLLAKAMAKFPGGTRQRWEKIADMVGRTVAEVAYKAKCVKTQSTFAISVSAASQGATGAINEMIPQKLGKKGQGISDSIISQRLDDEEGDKNTSKTRKRQTQNTKVERTLMIQQVDKNISDKNSRSEVGTGSGDADSATSGTWTQIQQKALEHALAQYPKGTPERWERIAEVLPGKSKEEIISRVKYLSEMIKKKKMQSAPKEDKPKTS